MQYPSRICQRVQSALLALPFVLLTPHVAAAQAAVQALGHVQAAAPVSLALALPLRNRPALDTLLRRLYDPADPDYHRFLTPAQFDNEFAPTPQEYQAAVEAARAQGLTITGTHRSRLLLDVSGPAAAVEHAFGVRMTQYVTANGRVFHAPNIAPALSGGLANFVCGVIGLDTSAVRRPHLERLDPARLAARPALSGSIGSGPSGGLAPLDIKAAYGLDSVPLDGTGQTLAVFELDGYNPSDIRAYESYFGLPQIPLENILVDNVSGQPGAGADETTLDIEMISCLADRAKRVLVYEGPNTSQGIIDTYARIADDDQAQEISTSWGFPEDQTDSATLNAEDAQFMKMATQGQAIFSATGDNGAFDDGQAYLPGTTTPHPTVDDPGSQPYMTAVGGTSLSVNAIGGTYQSESIWNSDVVNADGSLSGVRGSSSGASGGGVSNYWNMMQTLGSNDYQAGLSGTSVSATMRNVPDVTLNGDPDSGYAIYYGGQWQVYGGTSAAAPLWASFTALVNQERALLGHGQLGFLNPAIYAIGKGQTGNYALDFHDVTHGNNLYYSATSGYDLASGWGSFNGAYLLADLAGSSSPAAQTGPFDYPAGWNMLSLPYDDSSLSLNSVFGYSPVTLYHWNPATSLYLFTPAPPTDHVQLGIGYWVDFPQAAATQTNGTLADATQPFTGLTLSNGWNQIGDPFPFPIALANLQFFDAAGTDTSFLGAEQARWISGILYRYDTSSGSYTPLTEGSALQPGAAYWLYATQPLTVKVPPP